MSNYKETIIDLLRHGEPIGGRLLRGSQDDPLTEDGWSQMRASVGDHNPWQQVISSPLRRCSEFASQLSENRGLPYKKEAGFQEIGFGRWEGMSPEQIMAAFPGELEAYWRDPTEFSPPEGETLDAFIARIDSHWSKLLDEHQGQHVLLVCHGGVIRAIINKILEMPLNALWRVEVPYANISRIRVTHFDDFPATSNLVFHQPRL
ncbi:histidine phosphatase family protein [Alkalimarinus sediminis]|uniref:Alpha-ribazole phosphatase family protein n=1 Tax=Alkalimarinus sediminis TaxID=1632866 RepID=A0A9E8HJ04_9ALTE|nr:alpha-ribazole phosphatase family protein [Alkalimarinus sediminis]UZW75264.1 alpha-ribazole phosphatase family protein [Alkalimarinus sediminis]